MANAKSKPEPKVQPEAPAEQTQAQPEVRQTETRKSQAKNEKKREADQATPVVSFQDLEKPDENLPGVVAPKEK